MQDEMVSLVSTLPPHHAQLPSARGHTKRRHRNRKTRPGARYLVEIENWDQEERLLPLWDLSPVAWKAVM